MSSPSLNVRISMNISDKILFEDNPSVLTGFQGFAKIDKLGNRFLNLTFETGTCVLSIMGKHDFFKNDMNFHYKNKKTPFHQRHFTNAISNHKLA